MSERSLEPVLYTISINILPSNTIKKHVLSKARLCHMKHFLTKYDYYQAFGLHDIAHKKIVMIFPESSLILE